MLLEVVSWIRPQVQPYFAFLGRGGYRSGRWLCLRRRVVGQCGATARLLVLYAYPCVRRKHPLLSCFHRKHQLKVSHVPQVSVYHVASFNVGVKA